MGINFENAIGLDYKSDGLYMDSNGNYTLTEIIQIIENNKVWLFLL